MRLNPLLPLAAVLVGCNTPTFDLKTAKPTYGYSDGCTEIRLSGSAISEDATATVAGAEAQVVARGADADAGYWLNVYTPADPTGAGGFVDITLNSGADSATLTDAFYYTPCPNAPWFDAVYATDSQASPYDPWAVPYNSYAVSTGADVTFVGCGFDFDTMRVQLYRAADRSALVTKGKPGVTSGVITPEQTCGSGRGHFAAPDLPADGPTYYDLVVTDTQGNIVFPPDYTTCDPATADTSTYCIGTSVVCYGEGC